MGRIFAHVSVTRVMWEDEYQDYPEEGHGWVDVRWDMHTLYDSRNDVHPLVNEDENDRDELQEEITSALQWLEGGCEDNGNGMFCAREAHRPYDSPWSYDYAIHFTRKARGPRGWQELPWHPAKDGGFEI